MINTQEASVLYAQEYEAYQSLDKLSAEYGYASQKTFARVLAAIQRQRKIPIRAVVIGKRRKFNRHDIETLLI